LCRPAPGGATPWTDPDESGKLPPALRHTKENVGSMLNKALEALEDANADALQDVLKGTINFNRKIGQTTLDDDTLVDFIQNFDKIPLRDEDFEFPDLLGAAYEWLIKYFADSAGKKAGEFYTPAEVVRMCVEICDPPMACACTTPPVGSGGMLIQVRDYVREKGQRRQQRALFGQEKMGTTWSICKMNMLLHGIPDADIRQQDTLREPQHPRRGRPLRRFDRVLANPPFSQNYIKKGHPVPRPLPGVDAREGQEGRPDVRAAHAGRAEGDGRLATVMPHGVLFRGGEEREARRLLYRQRLPGGRGRPARQPVLWHRHSGLHPGAQQGRRGHPRPRALHQRRPRIPRRQGPEPPAPGRHRQDRHAYRAGQTCPPMPAACPSAEIAAEDYNCNIRRYVDNAPPPEPHDVRAHLHGGVPVAEVEALAHFWHNYPGLRESCFTPRAPTWHATPTSPPPWRKPARHRRPGEAEHPGVQQRHAQFMAELEAWWQQHLPWSKHWRPMPTTSTPAAAMSTPCAPLLLESIERTFGRRTC
jgi:type I restriction enzyme M protein